MRYGADAIGLVAAHPSGPGIISDDLIAQIAAKVSPGVDSFLLTDRIEADDILAHHQQCRTTCIQITRHIDLVESKRLALHKPVGVRLIQVIHVGGGDALELARLYLPYVDALLLDSGKPTAAVAELGGTGRTHDWSVSRKLVDAVAPRPVFLAGGLKASNINAAREQVRPYGFDLCSGVRTNDVLDETKLASFMKAAKVQD